MNSHSSSLDTAAAPSLDQQIRDAAYFRWLDRGCPLGDDWSDWFAALRHLQAAHAAHLFGEPFPTALPDAPHPALLQASRPVEQFPRKKTPAPERRDSRPAVLSTGAVQRVRARRHVESRRSDQSEEEST